jgi:ABC-2 type transport system permease protein
VFFVGGLTSYRALFGWLSPWVFVPAFLVTPVVQILLFTYVGRAAGVGSAEFFVVGNALQYAAIPCLFAMGNTVADERKEQTLGLVLVTPAPRAALFLGRALPVVANGFAVAVFGLVAGGALLRVDVPVSAYVPILGVTVVVAYACTGIGFVNAALALRFREVAVLSNVTFGVLLVFCGVNVPVADLPRWMAAVSTWLPLTHGIAAARLLADGAAVHAVAGLIAREALVGTVYLAGGYALLRAVEVESRRRATLEIS